MDWLNALGGASKGILEGQLDNQRQAEFQFLQQQRKRMLDQQKIEDEADAAYRNVRAAGEYDEEDRSGMVPGEVGPAQATKRVTRTQDDVRREQLAALNRGSSAQRAQATQLQSTWNQQDQYEWMKHKQMVTDAAMKASMLARSNPEAAIAHLSEKYDAFPDGQRIVMQRGQDGKAYYGVADRSGKWVPGYEPQPVTVAAAHQLAGEALQFATPEMYHMVRQANTADRTAGAHEITARAAADMVPIRASEVESQNKYRDWESTGAGGVAKVGLMQAQANHANNMSAASKFGTPIAGEDAQGNAVYGIPFRNADGSMGIQPISMGAGFRPAKQAQVMNDLEKTMMGKYAESLVTDPPRTPAEKAKRAADFGVSKFVGTDPMIAALLNAGPDGRGATTPSTPTQGLDPYRKTGASALSPTEVAGVVGPNNGPDAATTARYKAAIEKYPLSTIRAMSPAEAARVYREEGSSLSPDQVRELRKRV